MWSTGATRSTGDTKTYTIDYQPRWGTDGLSRDTREFCEPGGLPRREWTGLTGGSDLCIHWDWSACPEPRGRVL